MSNRIYRLLFGATLLTALYLDLPPAVYALIALASTEGLTNLRIPRLLSRWRHGHDGDPAEGGLGIDFPRRFGFESERAWRLAVAAMLATSYLLYPGPLWFFPWFMGFAILGAGISGVCPVLLLLKWAGFR